MQIDRTFPFSYSAADIPGSSYAYILFTLHRCWSMEWPVTHQIRKDVWLSSCHGNWC